MYNESGVINKTMINLYKSSFYNIETENIRNTYSFINVSFHETNGLQV